MIKSFYSKVEAGIFLNKYNPRFSKKLQLLARDKMKMIDITKKLEDLRIPWSNHLEVLSGNRKGQHSIKVNQQWRLCFTWIDSDAYDVELVDYHK